MPRRRRHAQARVQRAVSSSSSRQTASTRPTLRPCWCALPHLSIPGIVPGGYPEYPDPLRGGVLTVAVHTVRITLLMLARRRTLTRRHSSRVNRHDGSCNTPHYSVLHDRHMGHLCVSSSAVGALTHRFGRGAPAGHVRGAAATHAGARQPRQGLHHGPRHLCVTRRRRVVAPLQPLRRLPATAAGSRQLPCACACAHLSTRHARR